MQRLDGGCDKGGGEREGGGGGGGIGEGKGERGEGRGTSGGRRGGTGGGKRWGVQGGGGGGGGRGGQGGVAGGGGGRGGGGGTKIGGRGGGGGGREKGWREGEEGCWGVGWRGLSLWFGGGGVFVLFAGWGFYQLAVVVEGGRESGCCSVTCAQLPLLYSFFCSLFPPFFLFTFFLFPTLSTALDDHEGVVDDEDDGEHEAEERQRVHREPESREIGSSPTSDTANGEERDQRRPPVCRKDEADEHHQRDRSPLQTISVIAGASPGGGVERHLVGDPRREALENACAIVERNLLRDVGALEPGEMKGCDHRAGLPLKVPYC